MQQFTTTQLFVGFLIIVGIAFIYNWCSGKRGSYNTSCVMPPTIHDNPGTGSNPGSNPGNKFVSKGERECRRVLEHYYQKPFPNKRPSFMKNSITGASLELDCFNDTLKVACEYHGIQHYKFTPRFHKSKQHFYNQQYRDKETRELCQKKGIFLIEVPYTIAVKDIENFIVAKLNPTGQ